MTWSPLTWSHVGLRLMGDESSSVDWSHSFVQIVARSPDTEARFLRMSPVVVRCSVRRRWSPSKNCITSGVTQTSMLRPAAATPRQTCCQFTHTTPTLLARRATHTPSIRAGSGLADAIARNVSRAREHHVGSAGPGCPSRFPGAGGWCCNPRPIHRARPVPLQGRRIHLPQLHRRPAFPPLPLPVPRPTSRRVDQVQPNQRPIHSGFRRHRIHTPTAELEHQVSRPPTRPPHTATTTRATSCATPRTGLPRPSPCPHRGSPPEPPEPPLTHAHLPHAGGVSRINRNSCHQSTETPSPINRRSPGKHQPR